MSQLRIVYGDRHNFLFAEHRVEKSFKNYHGRNFEPLKLAHKNKCKNITKMIRNMQKKEQTHAKIHKNMQKWAKKSYKKNHSCKI